MPWPTLTRDFGEFVRARALALHGGDLDLLTARSSDDVRIIATRAAVDAVTTSGTPLFAGVAAPFLESLGQSSVLDRILAEGSATSIPYSAAGTGVNISVAVIAGGAVDENSPKPVRAAMFEAASITLHKAVSLVVASEEWLRGPGASEALTAEMRRALSQATNSAFADALAAVADTQAASGSTAANVLTDLGAAVAALGVHERSKFYALVSPSTMAELALKPSSATVGPVAFPDLTTSGGTIGGVSFMPVESLETSPPDAIIFDSSRLAVGDGGLKVDSSRHASLQLDDAPSGASAAYSLFQRNARGVRAERYFSLATATPDTSGGSLVAVRITGAW